MNSPAQLGVLLMAYGSPNSLEEVEPYYTDIRRGRKPPPDLLAQLVERYRSVGGRTPLLEISRAQATALRQMLGDRYRVFLGMKHWHPYIVETMAEMQVLGINRAAGIVLAPHFSHGSIGEYAERIERAKGELAYDLDLAVVPNWHLNPHYLEAVANHVREGLARFGSANVTIFFTAHSLPKRVVEAGDPYHDQLIETSRAVAAMVAAEELVPEQPAARLTWTFSFQSAGRTPDPWLGPDILQTVDRLAAQGVKNILVAPVGFITDHLEIFYDIDREAVEAAKERGVKLQRMRSLNDDPDLIAALADVARAALS